MDEPHLLLHFDVNKTVIMHDPVQGKTLLHILNDLLTERALGRIDGKSQRVWNWNGERALDKTREVGEDWVSYGNFLRTQFPMSSDPKKAEKNKHKRKMLRQNFTVIGNPGQGLVTEYDALLQHLLLPSTAASEAQLEEVGAETFGDDLHSVAKEFNSFCEGRHPCFPLAKPMDGSGGGVDRRMHLDEMSNGEMPRFGTFLRAEGTTALIMGTFKQPKTVDKAEPLAFYASRMESVRIVQGLPKIHDFLARRWRHTQETLALRDFYPHWFFNMTDATAGKLLTLDPTDDTENVHAMFFDDNILSHDAHIVDARFAHNDVALDFEDTRELHLMRVEPLDVIQRDTYFIERLETSLQRWKQKRQ
ncbi:unnamed protein product [Peronospora destructor]|uniref:Uncharacterized protein n=1 Tax=Peronospora destructor TaxID=86335 RepID=A0AAV0UAC5_9STRA|nr:unnamed protein product [Peronospora destructor]